MPFNTPSSSGGSAYTQVANYSALPSASSVDNGTIYAVAAAQGVWLINRKPAGFYISDGVSAWTYMDAFPDSFKDGNLNLYNSTDITKIVAFDASGITTGTTRTFIFPNKSGTFAVTSDIPASLSTVTKTANYTATTSDTVILADATSGNITITLYTAVGNQGKQISIKKIDSSANTVTIDPNSTETVDGSLTAVISVQNVSLTMTSDNANWYIY